MKGTLVSGLVAQKQGQPFLVNALSGEALVLKTEGALGEPVGLSDFLNQEVFGGVGRLVLFE